MPLASVLWNRLEIMGPKARKNLVHKACVSKKFPWKLKIFLKKLQLEKNIFNKQLRFRLYTNWNKFYFYPTNHFPFPQQCELMKQLYTWHSDISQFESNSTH